MIATSIRPPAVAGYFYPADPSEREQAIDQFVADQQAQAEPWRAALVPHAGWSYSGRLAAAVFGRCQIPDRVLILCPKHRQEGAQWAIAPVSQWEMPGLSLPGAPELVEQLTQSIDGLAADAAPHREEHAIEVQLPFLARQNSDVQIAGIAIGRADYEDCLRFAEGLADVMRRSSSPPLLVISSDMNHFASDQENRRRDHLALAALEQRDPRALYDVCLQQRVSMCGLRPAVIVLEALQRLDGLNESRLVAYATSADVSGDTSRVVGYAGMLFR